MSDTPKGNRQKMDALDALREECQDADIARFVAIHLAAPLCTSHLVELAELCRALKIARDRIEPHRGPNGEWVDRQDLGGPNETPPHPRG